MSKPILHTINAVRQSLKSEMMPVINLPANPPVIVAAM